MNGRIAFCFHLSEASGASLWMKNFLLNCDLPHDRALAVFPSESPLEEELSAAGFVCEKLAVHQVSFSQLSLAKKVQLLRNRISTIRQYCLLFKRHNVKLVYVNSSVQVAPMLAARLCGIPFVVHVHETWTSGSTARWNASSPSFFLKKFFVRHLAAGAIFAAQVGMEPFGTRRPTWIFSPNGYMGKNDVIVPPDLHPFREPKAIVFLFLGTLQRHKGLHDLLRVWKQLLPEFPNIRLWVAGIQDENEKDEAIRSFLKNGLPQAELLGFRKDAAQLVAAADFVVLPSYGEAMPLVIVEAMMLGTPVIARDVGDIPWLLDDQRGVLLRGPGEQPLYKAMKWALEHPQFWREMTEKSRAFAQQNLTKEKQCGQIMDFLSQFIQQ